MLKFIEYQGLQGSSWTKEYQEELSLPLKWDTHGQK
jgi:hypothetical protein